MSNNPQKVSVNYQSPPTIAEFHASTAFVRGVMGPVGSGKSVGMVMEVLQNAIQQAPGPDGIRRTRMGILRGTYPQLLSTTIKTWQDWTQNKIPGLAQRCPIKYSSPIHQTLLINDMCCEIFFLAASEDADVDKLKSLELTMLWINEVDGVSEQIFNMGRARVNRFPSMADGGATRPGIIVDYNAVDPDHWLYKMVEEEDNDGYEFFNQPPAIVESVNGELRGKHGKRYSLNLDAENLVNLPPDYYSNLVPGSEPDWIQRYLKNGYGYMKEGTPVYGQAYNDAFHCSTEELPAYPGIPLLLMFDFGATPACIIAQYTPKGQFRVLDELITPDDEAMSISLFADTILMPYLATHFAGFKVSGWGDPAGEAQSQTNESTCYDELEERGVNVEPAHTNKPTARMDAVTKLLSRNIGGQPGFLLSPKCKVLRAGFLGKYRFAKKKAKGQDGVLSSRPHKNNYSHPHDALQYGALGVLGPTEPLAPVDPATAAAAHAAANRRPLDQEVGY